MKEEKPFNQGVVGFLRDSPPANYSIKIDSFSELLNLKIEKYESATFSASGLDWRLILYPNGNAKRGGQGYISCYLAIDTQLDSGEAHATYKMFVYNHHKDKYLTIEGDSAHQVRYHRARKESGFDRLMSLATFNDATNGYLVDDSCIFGVEVYAVKHTGNGETLKVNTLNAKEVTFNWKFCKLSKRRKRIQHGGMINSEGFTVGNYKWRLLLYPNGDSSVKDCLSLYLELVEAPATGKKVFAEFSLEIENQQGKTHHQKRGCAWFSTIQKNVTTARNWGWPRFILLSELEKKSSGFKQQDTILLQAKVNIKTEVTDFS